VPVRPDRSARLISLATGPGVGPERVRFDPLEIKTMDATRTRRTRDHARQAWYGLHRQRRFARFLGFGQVAAGEAKASRAR
jgi:hypothetical protein